MYQSNSQQSLTEHANGAVAGGPKQSLQAGKREGQNWLWSKEYLEFKSPSRMQMSYHEERVLRAKVSKYIQDSGMVLEVPQLTIATAIVFCHRFFTRESFQSREPYLVATACLFLAGKVEESPKPLKEVIKATVEVRYRHSKEALESLKDQEEMERRKDQILSLERSLLSCLGFDFRVDHPYKYVIRYLKDVIKWYEKTPEFKAVKEKQKNIAQVAWNFVNDSLRTTISVQYDVKKVAIAVIYLAVKFLKVQVLCQHNEWWVNLMGKDKSVDVRKEEALLEAISDQILDLYENQKKGQGNKEKVMKAGSVAKSGIHVEGKAAQLKNTEGKDSRPPAQPAPARVEGASNGLVKSENEAKPEAANGAGLRAENPPPEANTPPKTDEESLKRPSPRSDEVQMDPTQMEADGMSGKIAKIKDVDGNGVLDGSAKVANGDTKIGSNLSSDMNGSLKRRVDALDGCEEQGMKRVRVDE